MKIYLILIGLTVVFCSQCFADQEGPSKGKLLRTLRILTLNVYGKKERNCEDRLRTIAKKILEATPRYDIVSFNEHYNPWLKLWLSCDGKILTQAMYKGGFYKDSDDQIRNHKHYPKGGLIQANGSNSLFTLHNIIEFDWWKFKNTRRILAMGYMLNRVQISRDLTIDVWTAHLESKGPDNCSRACREKQFKQVLATQERFNQGNPVILLGDFNMGGPLNLGHKKAHDEIDAETFFYPGNAGYDKFMNEYENPIDVWVEANPKTNLAGYTFDCLNNTTVKGNCTSQERIDYIFIPTSPKYQSDLFTWEVINSKVVRWKTDKGVDVSDHYGVEATLNIYEK
ncbi:MAG: endonuclease/exonuclease/phosphatase family protein [Bdellovibrio sp.]|nr:endonuclease/exonuclease/phosphatase family protein [Bdellovibrio sp.]